MEFLDVVINVGTVEADQSPVFDLEVSNKFPSVGEYIALPLSCQQPEFFRLCFSWYTNEIPETQIQYLNQPSVSKSLK